MVKITNNNNNNNIKRKKISFKHVICLIVFATIWAVLLLLFLTGEQIPIVKTEINNNLPNNNVNWCDNVQTARKDLNPKLHVSYPCETMNYATSAIVCFLTAGVPDGQGSRVVFTGRDYINGALALGYSIQKNIRRKDVHRLLLIKEGFSVPHEDRVKLEAVGWTIGKAPDVPISNEYVPRFQRYKTTYTKILALGLSEYKCALLMDADAFVVGELDNLLSCNVFDKPQYKVAGTLDYYRGKWYHFNTGSILWRTSSHEMNRVFALTTNSSFMQRFASDQIFLNTVYPDRTNVTKNELILNQKEVPVADWGEVVPLPWSYNAQTHVEVELPHFWNNHLDTVRIIHFTEKKGWQCPERHNAPPKPQDIPEKCKREIPDCYCIEGYRWWDALRNAEELGKKALR